MLKFNILFLFSFVHFFIKRIISLIGKQLQLRDAQYNNDIEIEDA